MLHRTKRSLARNRPYHGLDVVAQLTLTSSFCSVGPQQWRLLLCGKVMGERRKTEDEVRANDLTGQVSASLPQILLLHKFAGL